MLLRHAIGYVLRKRRLERGKTLRELSEEARISLPYLSEIERGRKEASSEILWALCRVLDLTERELLEDVADEYAAQAHEVVEIRSAASSIAPVSAHNTQAYSAELLAA